MYLDIAISSSDYDDGSEFQFDPYVKVWAPQSLRETRGGSYRKKTIFGQIRQDLGPIMRELAKQKESRVVEGHLCRIMCTCSSRFRRNTRLRR